MSTTAPPELPQDSPPTPNDRGAFGSRLAQGVYQIVVLFLGLNILAGVGQAFLASGAKALPTFTQIEQTYLVQFALNHPLLFWPIAFALIVLGVVGYFQDQRAKRKYVEDILGGEWQKRQSDLGTVVRKSVAQGFRDNMPSVDVAVTQVTDVTVETAVSATATALTPMDFSEPEGLRQPPAATGLVGRDAEQKWLLNSIRSGTSAGVWGISGLGGIGKTALVAWCLKRIKDRLTGGCAVVHANDMRDPDEVLRVLVRKFVPYGTRLIAQATTTPEMLRSRLQTALTSIRQLGKLVVVVIDNVEPELARHAGLGSLLDLIQTSGASVILTSREQLPGAYVQDSRGLDTLDPAEAVKLFARLSGRFTLGDPNETERQQIADICGTFAGHALATVVAASELEQHPGLALSAYRARLALPFAALDLFSREAPEGVSRVFASSYDQLDRGAQHLFRALGALAGRGCTIEAARTIGIAQGQTEADAQANLDRLIRANLVNVVLPERVRIELHPLVQQFARRLFATLPSSQQNRLYGALATHYAAWSPSQKTDQLTIDESNLLAALDWAARHAPRSDAARAGLAYGLRWYWHDRFEFAPAFRWLPPGYRAMQRLRFAPWAMRRHGSADGGVSWRMRQGGLAYALGLQHQLHGDTRLAARWFKRSERLIRRVHDPLALADVLSGLAVVAQQRGESLKARGFYLRSLKLFEDNRNEAGIADALYRLGFLALRVGNTASAEEYFTKSLEHRRDEWGQSVIAYSLGNVYQQTGDFDKAQRSYEQGLDSCRRQNNLRGQGAILKALGDLSWQMAKPDDALRYLDESLEVFGRIFDLQGRGVALYSSAFVLRQLGRIDEAKGQYQESLSLRRRVNDRRGDAFVRKGQGDLTRRIAGNGAEAGKTEAAVRVEMKIARQLLLEGLVGSKKVGDRRNTGVALKALGDWAWQAGDLAAARSYYAQSLPIRVDEVHERHGEVITRKALADLALVEGDLDHARSELAICRQEFEALHDDRGLGATLHSLSVLAWKDGDLRTAEKLLGQSSALLKSAKDWQFQAVALYTSACLAEANGALDRARQFYRDGLAIAAKSRAVHIDAILREGLGTFLLSHGSDQEMGEGRQCLRHAAAVYAGLSRRADARRAHSRLQGEFSDRPVDRMPFALTYDLDEGPNGQGFTVPNDRGRTTL